MTTPPAGTEGAIVIDGEKINTDTSTSLTAPPRYASPETTIEGEDGGSTVPPSGSQAHHSARNWCPPTLGEVCPAFPPPGVEHATPRHASREVPPTAVIQ